MSISSIWSGVIIRSLEQDQFIYTKVVSLEGHPLYNMLPEVKNTRY